MAFDEATLAFLCKTIGEDPSSLSWGMERIKAYLRELKRESKGPEIHWTFPKSEVLERALPWIEKYDPALNLFARVHRDFEQSRAKAVGFYRMPATMVAAREQISKALSPVEYDLRKAIEAASGDQEIVEIIHTGDEIVATIAETATQNAHVSVGQGQIALLWGEVQKLVRAQLPDFTALDHITAVAKVKTRSVVTARLNFGERRVELSTDTFSLKGVGTQALTTYAGRFRRGLAAILAGVSGGDELAERTVSVADLTADVAARFRRLSEKDRIAISAAIVHRRKEPDSEVEEKVTDEILNQTRTILRAKIQAHYDAHHSLLNFFDAHKDHDPDHTARILERIRSQDGAYESGCTCFVFFAASPSGPGKPAKIDVVKVVLDPENGVVRGESKEDTAERWDVVLSEIRNLLPAV